MRAARCSSIQLQNLDPDIERLAPPTRKLTWYRTILRDVSILTSERTSADMTLKSEAPEVVPEHGTLSRLSAKTVNSTWEGVSSTLSGILKCRLPLAPAEEKFSYEHN